MKRATKLNVILADWDEGKLPDGSTKFFSVSYIKQNGEFVYIARAKRSGLRANMNMHDLKGAQPVDESGNEIGHVHSIWIHSIIQYKGLIYYEG